MYFLLCAFFLFSPLAALFPAAPSSVAESFLLKKRLLSAKPGDYIVTESNKMISLLALRSKTARTLVLEEISIPSNALKKRPASWGEWVRQGAKGHSSWSMVEVDFETGNVLECYSFSKNAWIRLSSQDSFLATLLTLPLRCLPEAERRKIGPAPLEGEADRRPLWNPPLLFEGKTIPHAEADAFEAVWPEDGSPLSGRSLTLFFDKTLHFPFPCWFQVETAHASIVLSVLDTGKNLPSPHKTIPRRIPQFLGPPEKRGEALVFCLKCPKYYENFELFAIDITQREKGIFPIPHTRIPQGEEVCLLEVSGAVLDASLEKNHRYTWLLVPEGHTELYAEITQPLLWNP